MSIACQTWDRRHQRGRPESSIAANSQPNHWHKLSTSTPRTVPNQWALHKYFSVWLWAEAVRPVESRLLPRDMCHLWGLRMRSVFKYWVSGMFAVSTMIAAITGYKWWGLTFRHHNLNRKKESGLSKSPRPRFPFLIMAASSCASEIQSRFDGINVSLEWELCQAGRGVQVKLSYAHVQGSALYNAGPPIGISVVHGSLHKE